MSPVKATATEAEVRQAARQLAEGVSSTLKDDERANAGAAARLICEGLREVCKEDDLVAAKVAMTFARLLATLLKTPFQHVGETMDNTIVGYSMAAGHLAGGVTLPEPPEDDPKLAKLMEELGLDPDELARAIDSVEAEASARSEGVRYL